MVREYSGGMIRRLEIAQSMLHRPPVLFLDEPTVGLDPVARRAVWEHIEELRDRFGTTVLLTTHLMEEADNLCSRVAIMHLGRVAAIGTPAALKDSLGGDKTTWTTSSSIMPAAPWTPAAPTGRPPASGAPPGAWVDGGGASLLKMFASIGGFVKKTLVIAELEAQTAP